MYPIPNGKPFTNLEEPVPLASNPDTIKEQTHMPNPSLQVTADHQLKQLEAPVLAPKKGDVLLQAKVTGICGYVFQHSSIMYVFP